MKLSFLVFMLLSVLFNAGAHIILKYNAKLDSGFTQNINPFSQPHVSILFIAGALCFATSIFFYQIVLRSSQLSIAYSILTGLNYIIIVIYSFAVFKDKLTLIQNLGLVFIFIGLVLLLFKFSPEEKTDKEVSTPTAEETT